MIKGEKMNFIKKWYTYQKERFPVLMYGIYIASIVFAVYCCCLYYSPLFKYTVYSADAVKFVEKWTIVIPMFIVAFMQFLMVRIVDEFKDYDEDKKFRPYRPVPRGLVTLNELSALLIICIILQIGISILFKGNIVLLFVLWLFFLMMSRNFFMKKFLDKHLLIEVLLDEIMMPIMVLYLSSFCLNKWGLIVLLFDTRFPILLLISYIVSWIVEVARKVRSKDMEETGVKTYTAVLGIPKAMMLLSLIESILFMFQTIILTRIIWVNIVFYIIVMLTNLLFIYKQKKSFAKTVELSANFYILFVYVSMIMLII